MSPWAAFVQLLASIGNAIAEKAKAMAAKKAAADLQRGAEINAQMSKDGDAIRERIAANAKPQP